MKICPFAEIGFSEDDGSGIAQFPGDECIIRWDGSIHESGSGCSRHVVCIDVVFQQDWHSVERSADTSIGAFTVQRIGDSPSIWIHGTYRI